MGNRLGHTARGLGKEFASEAANLLLEFAFDQLRAHRVVAFCHAENTASVNVMKKSE